MEQERIAREKEEEEKRKKAQKIKEEFGETDSQWKKDKKDAHDLAAQQRPARNGGNSGSKAGAKAGTNGGAEAGPKAEVKAEIKAGGADGEGAHVRGRAAAIADSNPENSGADNQKVAA